MINGRRVQQQQQAVQVPRNRAERADIVIQFVQQSDNAFNNWYYSSI